MWDKIIKLTRAGGKRVLKELLQVFIDMFRFVTELLAKYRTTCSMPRIML